MKIDMTPLYAAVDGGQSETLDDLLCTREEFLSQSEKDELLTYCLAQRRQDEAMIALAAGGNPDARTPQGSPLLVKAMQDMDMEAVVLLLVSGADPNLRNEEGLTALHAAAQQDVPVAIELLGRYGASLDIETLRGETPIQIAASSGSPNAVNFLLQAGARHDPQDLRLRVLAQPDASITNETLRVLGEPASSAPAPRRMRM